MKYTSMRCFTVFILLSVFIGGCSLNRPYDTLGLHINEWHSRMLWEELVFKQQDEEVWKSKYTGKLFYFKQNRLVKIEALPPPSPAEQAMKLQALGMLFQLNQQTFQQQRQLQNQPIIIMPQNSRNQPPLFFPR